jgi:HEAT repeat protein
MEQSQFAAVPGSNGFHKQSDKYVEIYTRYNSLILDKRVDVSVLLEIVDSASPQIRERIAEHQGTPQHILGKLAKDKSPEVRAAVADNNNTPLDMLWDLAQDQCPDVRYALAENHNIPISLLMSLSEDHHPYVSYRAQQTLDRIGTATKKEGLMAWLQPKKHSQHRQAIS